MKFECQFISQLQFQFKFTQMTSNYLPENLQHPISDLALLKINSYRSGTADHTSSANSRMVLDPSPTTAKENAGIAVQVKKGPRKGLSKRMAAQKPSINDMKPKASPHDVVYGGTASSPHIKPEYLNARLQNSAFFIRAKSIGKKVIPAVQGQAITQPLPQQEIIENFGESPQSDDNKAQKLLDFKSRATRHPLYQHQLAVHGSNNSHLHTNNMNKDLVVASDQLLQQVMKRPRVRKPVHYVDTLGVGEDSIASRHHQLKVSMPKEQRSLIDTEASKGSQLLQYGQTQDDYAAPTHMLLQQSNNLTETNTENQQQSQQTLSNRDKIKKKSEKIQVGTARAKQVQLTEFLAKHTIQQQQQIQMAEHQIEGQVNHVQHSQQIEQLSHWHSQEHQSLQSQEEGLAGKNQDVSPTILLPKLQNSSVHSAAKFKGQEQAFIEDNAFASMVNSMTSAEIEMRQGLLSPVCSSQPNVTRPQLTNVAKPWAIKGSQRQDQGKILVQKGRVERRIGELSELQKKRTKSLMASGQLKPNRIVQVNPLEPSQLMIEEEEGFQIRAERKAVVPNMWAESKNWQRKRNTMSSNEIKRQATLLNNLPMISKHLPLNKPSPLTVPMNSLQQVLSPTSQIPEGITKQQVNISTNKSIMLENSSIAMDSALTKTSRGNTPYQNKNRLSTNGEVQTLTQDVRESPDPADLSQEKPHTLVDSLRVCHGNFVKEMQQRREQHGIITADVNTRTALFRDSPVLDKSGKLLKKMAKWGKQMIQIGSRYMLDPRSTSQDWAPGRRLNTSHEGTHILTSLDGSVIMRPARGDCKSFEIRNQKTGSRFAERASRASKNRYYQVNPWASVHESKPLTSGETQIDGPRLCDFGSMMNKTENSRVPNYHDSGSTTVQQAKQTYKSRQKQINDMFNLGNLQSERLKNIKISRLNELGVQEEGNPLDHLNKLQWEHDQRTQILLLGGEQTKVLQNLNTQFKYQVEAIQDFSCRESRFNKTEGFGRQPGAKSLMSLKKLIGRQAILFPEKLKHKQSQLDENSKDTALHEDKDENSSRSATSRESFDHKIQANILQQILSDDKLQQNLHTELSQFSPREEATEISQMTAALEPRASVISAEKQKEKKLITNINVILSDTGTLIDETSPKQGEIFTKETQILSPQCNKIRLFPKVEQIAQKRMLNQLAQRSREMVEKNRSRSINNTSDSRPIVVKQENKSNEFNDTIRDSQNKDMQDMLNMTHTQTQYAQADESMVTDLLEQSPLLNPQKMDKAVMFQGLQELNTDRPISVNRRTHINNNMQHPPANEKLDSSENEDNSISQLHPMGIDEVPENEYADKRVLTSMSPKKLSSKAKSSKQSSDDKFAKQQVYAVYDDQQPQTASRLDGVSSDPAFAANSKMVDSDDGEQQDDETMLQKPNSQDYSTQPDLHAPIISVTSVKIQKAKKAKHLKTSIGKNAECISPIKHVDQSLQLEPKTGNETTDMHQIGSQDSQNNEEKVLSAECSSAQNFKEIVRTKTSDDITSNGKRGPPMETLQDMSLNLDSFPLQDVSLEKDASELISSGRLNCGNQALHQDKGTSIKQSVGTKCSSDYPKMLNLLSKKQELSSPKVRRKHDKSQTPVRKGHVSPTPHNLSQLTLQSDILEQLNAVNQMMATNFTNGYHMLEPKLFSTDLKTQIIRQQSPIVSETPKESTGPKPSTKIMQDSRFQPSNTTNANLISSRALAEEPPSTQMRDQQQQSSIENSKWLDEIGFVSHAVMENRLHTQCQVKQQMEQRKREYIKWKREQAASVAEKERGVSILSSQQISNERSVNANIRVLNSTELSFRPESIIGYDMEDLAVIDTESRDLQEKQHITIRKMRKVERDLSKCINIEKLMHKPIEEAYSALEDLVGRCPEHCANDCKHEPDREEDKESLAGNSFFSFKPKRKGLMNLNNMLVAELYKNHLKYEFKANELYSLLGEAHEPSNRSNAKRRYFLKFSSLQIINVDCQSGIICDIEPISLSMSKMIQLFFLSIDQLQQVLSECLYLQREQGGQLKLFLDQDLLRSKTHKMLPRVIREDYFSAPLQINLLETIEGNEMVKETFNLEIRLPRIEIVTTSQETNRMSPDEVLFKTTMTHNLTGMQMMNILKKYNLLDWADYAKKLIRERSFGIDSLQADGDASIIKFQQINYRGEFVLYKDPTQLAQEESIAKNLQLSMLMAGTITMQVEFFRPLYIKLKWNDTNQEPEDEYKPLPGYLPDSTKHKKVTTKAKTVAFMQIPFMKLPFIKQTFGDKIHEGDGCFLECIYDMVELQMDTKRDILRMAIPSWRRLDDINIRQLSQKYFVEHQSKNQAQQEFRKYLPQKANGEVKAMLNSNHDFAASAAHSQSVAVSKEHSQLQLIHASSQDMSVLRRPTPNAVRPNELIASSTLLSPIKKDTQTDLPTNLRAKKRLQISETMQCKLKISNLIKSVYGQQYRVGDKTSGRHYENHKKVTLAEFLGPHQELNF